MAQLEDMTGKKFGDMNNPLLVSVRSGAREVLSGQLGVQLDIALNLHLIDQFFKVLLAHFHDHIGIHLNKPLLGGKGANLAEMTSLGMPVPRGFTITTEACTQYYEDGRTINVEIQDEIMRYMA